MATWPTSSASTANLDAGTDKPSLARADLKTNVDNTNAIIDMFNVGASPTNDYILKYSSSTTKFEMVAAPTSGMTDFTVAGDSGTNQTIANGNTLTITGGTNLNSVASATDIITLNLDTTVTGLTSLTSTTVVAGTITTSGATDLVLHTNANTTSGVITIQDGVDGDITVVPNGTGKVHFETSETRVGINNTNAKITTKGTGDLTLDTNSGTNSGSIVIADDVNGNITLTPNGTGNLVLDGLNWPQADGTANYVLKTNGSGQLSWVAQNASGIASVSADASPTLGGNLNVSGYSIVSLSNGNINIVPNGSGNINITPTTGKIVLGSLDFPTGTGSNGQVLTTNGTGAMSWSTASVAISTGVSGLGTGVATFLATPSSANLISAITDESGTGALLFANSPTMVTPVLGTPASGNLTNTTVDGTNKVGYRTLPAVGTKTGSYTLAVGDVGEYVQVGSGGSITIPNSTFAEGDVVVIANNHSAAITITCTITDAYIAGTDTDKATVSLATRGVCNILFLSGTRCIITGNVS